MEIEESISSYFTSNNLLCRRIMQEQEFVKNRYGEKWSEMSWSDKEAAFNNVAVPAIIWDSYANVSKTDDYPDSFPRHVLQCGEKIVVDYDNDCQTWPDEHSGPFSWKTKSQQDLTLLDLEADQLTKKPEKARKPVPVGNAPKETFETKTCPWKRENGGIWDSPFLVAERGMDAVFTNKLVDLSSSAPTTSIIGQAVANQELKEKEEKKKSSVKEVKKRPTPPPPPPPNTTPKRVDYHTIPLPDSHPKKSGHRKSHRSSKAEVAEVSPQKSVTKLECSTEKKRDSGRFGNASPTESLSKNNLAFSTSDEKDFVVTDPALKDVAESSSVERSYFIGENTTNGGESSLIEPTEMVITGRDEYFVADEDEETTSFSSQNDESQSLLKPGSEFEKANLSAVTSSVEPSTKKEDMGSKRDSDIPVTGFDFLDDW